MNGCLVLKDSLGSACGYLQQRGGRISCRIKGDDEKEITILFSDGSKEIRMIGRDGADWPSDGRVVQEAFVCRDCEAQLATSETARAVSEAEQRQKLDDGRGIPEAIGCDSAERPEAEAGLPPPNLPQRRWPPPPCLEPARYRHGNWILDSSV